ncbi:MAG: twin-arginine translocase TatA/TatE family subunit [Actinomycetaceae bacterium]|nr:twin-arginine translocase TatA/TatE family subunit [Actinomycetaceae bacterium]
MKLSHWIVVIVVLIIIFGASKLPTIAKSIGQSAKVLKKEMKELQDDVPPETLPEGTDNSESGTKS